MPKRKELCYVWRKQRLRPDHDNRCGHLLGSMPICGNRLKRAQALFEMALAALVLITYCANRFYGAWNGVLPEQFCRNHFGDLCGGMLFPAYVNLLCLAVGRRALICGMPTSLATGGCVLDCLGDCRPNGIELFSGRPARCYRIRYRRFDPQIVEKIVHKRLVNVSCGINRAKLQHGRIRTARAFLACSQCFIGGRLFFLPAGF